MFLQEVNSLRFLARQGLAFRGHEKEERNFYRVMNLQAANHNDHSIKHWLIKFTEIHVTGDTERNN